jgi:MFS transporter, PAT family, beta-lactamase induction signal transducer AmpG
MTSADAKPRVNWHDAFSIYLTPRLLIVLFLGFSAGLPLALSGSTLRFWMRESGIDLESIGLFALVGTPYTIKFLWAPIVDALDVPILSALLGRRRGWLVLSQIILIVAIVVLAVCDPAYMAWYFVFGAALFVATASATQDILIDAFRIESLRESEQAAGSAAYVAAYRIGTLISTAGALYLVRGFKDLDFSRGGAYALAYFAMAALVLVGIVTTLLTTEPEKSKTAEAEHSGHTKETSLKRIVSAAESAFEDFLKIEMALVALAFVVLYKFTDAFAGIMTEAFVVDLQFTEVEYATIVKAGGLIATLAGGFAGGLVARAFPLSTSLWIGGILQAVANFGFSWLAVAGHSIPLLTFAIVLENFTSGIGTVVFVAYLSNLCRNPLHTATQYALLTALSAIGRTYLSSVAGFIAAKTGWVWFFAICAAAGIPGLILLAFLQAKGHFENFGVKTASAGTQVSPRLAGIALMVAGFIGTVGSVIWWSIAFGNVGETSGIDQGSALECLYFSALKCTTLFGAINRANAIPYFPIYFWSSVTVLMVGLIIYLRLSRRKGDQAK